jgi:dienelactone hydrolase
VSQGLADHGYVALALFYCGPDTSRPLLQEIPLERFKTALDWLGMQPTVDRNHIGVIGLSAGAAAALLAAATYPEVKAVVTVVPGSVVWEAPVAGSQPKSMFTFGGSPLPYIPIDISLPTDERLRQMRSSLLGLDTNSDTVIPVEKIKAPILLMSAMDDCSWPSALMADQIVARLKAKDFPFPYENLSYADAGHGFYAAHDSEDPWFVKIYMRYMDPSIDKQLGGTTAGNSAAQKDSWTRTLVFLHKYL